MVGTGCCWSANERVCRFCIADAEVALLRCARISIFKNVRFPLHDHVRHNSGWSNSQVLVRFALLQLTITMVFVVALVKIR